MPLEKWPGYNIWLKNPDKFTKMLRDFSQYDIIPQMKMNKIKTLLDSYSGDGESDVCNILHQWVFSWHKTAIASTALKKLQAKHKKKNCERPRELRSDL